MHDPAAKRALLQIRLLLVVYRAERERARRRGGNPDHVSRVRARCLEILDEVHARLNGPASSNSEVLAELAAARDEIALQTEPQAR